MPGQQLDERYVLKSMELSSLQMASVIPLADVVRVLNTSKVSFVVVGAYGLSMWMRKPRATEDVDVVVTAKHLKKAVKVLLEAFPQLEPMDLPVVIRLRDRETKDVAVDVMKPVQQPYCEAFRHTHSVGSGEQTYRVPSLEMALVMKFSAMTSLYRADKDKYQDAHDFILLVENNPDYDRQKLAELATLIYPEGGKDILEMARKVAAGEKLQL
jgi:hypothetical protein